MLISGGWCHSPFVWVHVGSQTLHLQTTSSSEVYPDKLTNDCKYRKSANSLFLAKIEDVLIQITGLVDSQDPKSQIQEVAVMVGGVAASLGPAVH